MTEALSEPSSALSFLVRWSGKEYNIVISEECTFDDLKRELYLRTNVLPLRQKLMGFKRKAVAADAVSDSTQLCHLSFGQKIMMVGTPEDDIVPDDDGSADVVYDFDLDDTLSDVALDKTNLIKIEHRVLSVDLKLMQPPREGKACLVLDVDYTLFDHRTPAETAMELARPFLHDFLRSVYAFYDIIIWSATTMKWVQLKMRSLNVLGNGAFGITALMDTSSMISVATDKYGVTNCKPLAFIWRKVPQYNPTNTLHIDDLGRNFLMNPKNGLKIKPFHSAPINRQTDRELLRLSRYLCKIAEMGLDFSTLDHKRWKRFMKENP
mmetsp:Transcript_51363/g.128893  ORF Transcript_51363/g.128893 Transcript_51363/m.128893 type:complete len:323 (-) Transcript_51363:96-1064(-)|eukprot:CAMPEP_0177668524 /NCGR_PEP_ID=MMETSP0447-20121125/22828_1 /TAXON_ID=0 /ORGANISM="Stygamoeba regulata, Strain BSH-02190019" /LENGTH=322 /DNA_ID=CAMNT_0019175079 /DNA_START=48 /DNA_END=1016 /DNA_ORIENTATION=+